MAVAGAIELGRAVAPLCLVDEATLGAPLGLGSRVRHGSGRVGLRDVVARPECSAFAAFADARREPTLDGTGTVIAEIADPAESLADGEARLHAWAAATLGYLAGLADAAVAAAVAHANAREQFGAPLGALPAVQGRLAEAALARDGLAARPRGRAIDPARAFLADELAWAGGACREVTAQAIQVHGGHRLRARRRGSPLLPTGEDGAGLDGGCFSPTRPPRRTVGELTQSWHKGHLALARFGP